MSDWTHTYIAALVAFLAGHDPYTTVKIFGSPPYTFLFLYPLSWIPPQFAILFSSVALFYLAWRFRKPWLIFVVGSSFPFIASSAYANIDWMIMLGVALGGQMGIVLDTLKPQDGLFAIVAELAHAEGWKTRARLIAPLVILLLLSIPLARSWITYLFIVGHMNDGIRNFSLFPYSIPIGLIAIYLAWKQKEPIWGCIASLALSPYFYINSALPLIFLLARKDWRLGVAANLIVWGIIFLIVRGYIPIKL